MKISSATKISTLLKANPASIETIASINKHFEKLRNPILRKVLAPRVTIADAARMGNCSIEIFFEKLKAIGFEIEDSVSKEIFSETKISIPDFVVQLNDSSTVQLDVRQEINNGRDPFQLIMGAIEVLPIGKTLVLINSFEPVPLINILSKKGYSHFVKAQSDGSVFTYLKKGSPFEFANNIIAIADSKEEFIAVKNKFVGKTKTIDVRQLEMPLPMTTILSELEKLPSDNALFVYHKKVPQFLFPELQERNFKWAIEEISEGEVNLIIYK